MIVGLFLRNYKTYQNINYIPLSKGKHFSAIVGENGVGKSSLLEAMNTLLNGADWNFNNIVVANGFETREPFVCAVFLYEKTRLHSSFKHVEALSAASELIWSTGSSGYNASHRKIATQFCEHVKSLKSEGYNSDTHYIFPFGVLKRSATGPAENYFSIFDSLEDLVATSFSEIANKPFQDAIAQLVQETYSYVYLPSEIDFQYYTKIEGQTIQALLGRKLDAIVRSFISSKTVGEINKGLAAFLEEIAGVLDGYEYRKPSKKQNLFNHSHFTEKVIEAFFDSKVLTRVDSNGSVPVNNLSSGEKRKALIDVARGFLLRSEQSGSTQVILAVDEPELSLHVSSCFEQFEKLKEIADAKVQTFVTTHWYGFMPVISNGVAVYVAKSDQARSASIIDLRAFRDDIKQLKKDSQGSLPANIELKGMNDLVQSIIASITGSDYRWIVCEGSSDKIYLDKFFSGINRPYVLAVGAAKNVKKVFSYLVMALEGDRDDVKGKVYFLLDTDKQFEKFESTDGIASFRIRRLLNSSDARRTELVQTTDSAFYPPTEIEDCLNSEAFLETLMSFSELDEYKEIFNKFTEELSIQNKGLPSGLAFNLRDSDKLVMEELFNVKSFKVKFALKYVQSELAYDLPAWVEDVDLFLNPPKPRVRRKPKPN